MANYLVTSGTLFESFETIGDWTQDSGSAVVDTSIYDSGAGSLKVTSASGTVGRVTKTINQSFANIGSMVFWVYVPDKTGILNVQFILSSSTSFASYFSVSKAIGVFHEGWNAINIARSDWTANGGESWSNTMVRLRLAVYADVAATPTVYFDSLYTGQYGRPKCVFTFDDGIATPITVGKPIMDAYGFKGTLYVVQNYLGTGGSFATESQIQTAYDAGWDVGNHTQNHVHLDQQATYTDIYNEMLNNQNYLMSKGWTRNDCHKHFCYPYGGYDSRAVQAANDLGMITSTSTLEKIQGNFLDNRQLLTRRNLGNTNSLATAKGYVDEAIAKGGTVIFQMHKLVANPAAATEWAPTDFQALVDYIASKKEQIDVVPITEWYRGLSNARKLV